MWKTCHNLGQMTTDERRRRRFTAAFRKEQVKYIDAGTRTIAEVCALYEVSYSSVKAWVNKYSSKPIADTQYVTCEADVTLLRSLTKEVNELKQFIGEQQLKIAYQEKLIHLAKEKLGQDFEKKV